MSQPISSTELADLWRQQARVLEAFAAARCESPEDCVQEAFIQLAAVIPVPDDPVAWLYRVVRNRAINSVRASIRRRHHESQLATEPPAVSEPDACLQWQQTLAMLAAALEQIQPDEREIVIAHVWGGLTFRQIAASHGISHAAAHRHFQHALNALRKTLPADEIHFLEQCNVSQT